MQVEQTATIKADGTATVEMGPTSYTESWETSIVGVLCTPLAPATTLTNIPSARIYANNVFVGGTYSGDQDSDTSMSVTIQSGQKIRAEWKGGDVGATVTLTVTGEKVIG